MCINLKDATDPLAHIPLDCHDLIFQHIRKKTLLNLSKVSSSWYKYFGENFKVMERTIFNFKDESQDALNSSSRHYQCVRIRQEITNQNVDFLAKLSKFLPYVRSISFEGLFTAECVELFFDAIDEHTLKLEHLSFVGEDTNISLLMQKFSVLKTYNTITLIGVTTQEFSRIFKNLNTSKLILKNLKLNQLLVPEFQPQPAINQVEILMSTVDENSITTLINNCGNLASIKFDNWDQLSESVKTLVTSYNNVRLEKSEKINLDPTLRIPEYLQALIFQHLPHEEILSTSTLSKTWFNYTKDVIAEQHMFFLRNSSVTKRNYCNIFFTIRRSFNAIIPLTMHLKEITIEIMPGTINHVTLLFSIFNFPKVKYLNLSCHQSEALKDLQVPTSALTQLVLTNFFFVSKAPQLTRFFKVLASAEKLKTLQFIDCRGLENLFSIDVTKFFFLSLQQLRFNYQHDEIKENVCNFLLSQRNSLKFLSLGTVDSLTVCKLFDDLKLTSFGLKRLIGPTEALQKRKFEHDTLTHLTIAQNELHVLKTVRRLIKNIQSLHVKELSNELLSYVQENLQSVNEVRFVERKLEDFTIELDYSNYRSINLIEEDLPFEAHNDDQE